MGWSGSTYARLLGFYQGLDHSRGFYVQCKRAMCHAEPRMGLVLHEFCLELALRQNASRQQAAEFLYNHSVRCSFM